MHLYLFLQMFLSPEKYLIYPLIGLRSRLARQELFCKLTTCYNPLIGLPIYKHIMNMLDIQESSSFSLLTAILIQLMHPFHDFLHFFSQPDGFQEFGSLTISEELLADAPLIVCCCSH